MIPLFAETVSQGLPGYAVGWFTLSLINAGLAQAKGHGGLFWWLASLLLGPVATFLIVVFLDRVPAPPAAAPPSKPAPDPYEV
jgi:hypothetical protein